MNNRFHVRMQLDLGKEVDLPDDVVRHFQVLRLRAGERIVLFNGDGGEYQAEVTSAGKQAVRARVVEASSVSRENPIRVHLGICVLKREAMVNVLSKATELGVREVTPVIAEHCTVGQRAVNARLVHWRGAIIAACEQSGLNVIPVLHEPMDLAAWVSARSNSDESSRAERKYIALPETRPIVFQEKALQEKASQETAPQETAPQEKSATDSLALLTGPEGGFAEHEKAAALDANFTPLNLGERILRAETAPIAAIARLTLGQPPSRQISSK